MQDLLKLNEPTAIVKSINIRHTDIKLLGTIKDWEDYNELFEVLATSGENDTVRIYICSNGGDVAIAEAIITAIHEAQERGALVVASIGFDCASAASAIALACSDLEVFDYSTMLVHCWVSGNHGHAISMLKDAEFNQSQSVRYLRRHYTNFLSEEEIQGLVDNPKDILFNAEQIVDRWENKLQLESEGVEDDGSNALFELIDQRIQLAFAPQADSQPIKLALPELIIEEPKLKRTRKRAEV